MPSRPAPTDHASIRILVVDDDAGAREVVSAILTNEGYQVESAPDGKDALPMLDTRKFDIVITDLKMPEVNGIEVLEHMREASIPTIGVVATGYGSIESAISAMKAGAFDYLTKPFHIDEIRHVVDRALEIKTLRQENTQLRRQISSTGKITNIVGNSPPMKRLKDLIGTVADSDSTILILGESGTGKELVARAIHTLSDRSEAPMIPVNCGAIPEDLLESELFGHVKGAFTGASMDRKGRFQLANGGTIFLDEIGDMSPKLQVKVLRVLQEQEFEPVGSTETVKVNVRVLAATNRDLEADVAEGRFREDLYYRLNVIPMHLPPLRERADDLALLLEHFTKKFNKSKGRKIAHFTPPAIAALQAHAWPGNVRELENLVERMAILHSEGEIDLEHLPEKVRGASGSVSPEMAAAAPAAAMALGVGEIDLNRVVGEFEFGLIQQALEQCGGVKNQAAQRLNIKRTTLVEKLKKYERIFAEEKTGAPA